MFCPKKWLNKKSLITPSGFDKRIQFKGDHKRVEESKWLQVPSYKEERQLIYIVNDWGG